MSIAIDPQTKPRRFVFVLMENFSLLSFASALECLRIANRMCGHEAYVWEFQSDGGDMVSCSAGTSFAVDSGLSELSRDDTVLICGGMHIRQI